MCHKMFEQLLKCQLSKNTYCLFERLFNVMKNDVFLLGRSFFFRDIYVFVLYK